jgi:hypothetical protein
MRLVPVRYLKEGTEVALSIVDHDNKLLLKSGQTLNQNLISRLEQKGIVHVYVHDEYCFDPQHKHPIELHTLYHCMLQLRQISKKIESGTSSYVDIVEGLQLASTIADEMIKNQENFKIRYEPHKVLENEIVEKTLYVALMAVGLGVKMKLPKPRLVKLCMAVLLCDISLVSPKIKINSQAMYLMHPKLSYEHLKMNYALDKEILEAVLQHHELYDGTGFPNQLKGEEIGEFARIIAVIDRFYEIQNNHDMFLDSHQLFEAKVKMILKKFDGNILMHFFKYAEIFRPDTLLRLTNDDIVVVTRNNPKNPFKPIVKVIKSKIFEIGEEIDLNANEKLIIKNIEFYV